LSQEAEDLRLGLVALHPFGGGQRLQQLCLTRLLHLFGQRFYRQYLGHGVSDPLCRVLCPIEQFLW
jgi:hypothetical protein